MYRPETATDKGGGEENSPARAYLQRYLQEHAVGLQAIICGYVAKMGLARGQNIKAIAAEVFQDAALETLTHAERFKPATQARAWFLAIAANILKRHRASYLKRYRFELSTSSLAKQSAQEREQDVLDQIMTVRVESAGPEQMVVERESVHELLALVADADAQLLHMTLVQGWNADALGQWLGITPGAARVRVHRALSRLRMAWRESEQRKERGGYHG